MKKIILVLLFIASFIVPVSKVYAENEITVRALYTTVNIYAEASAKSEIIYECSYGDTLKLEEGTIIVGLDKLNYYKVIINKGGNSIGYVLCSQVIDINYNSPKRELDYNASIKKQTQTYVYVENELKPSNIILDKGERIKIIDGYNPNKTYTRIQYKSNTGEIVTTFIDTSSIEVSNISRGTIVAIILIVTTISLVLIIFGINIKKKKKRG